MKIQIESTDQLTMIDGVPVRVWKGTTAGGVECFVFIHRIAVKDIYDTTQFSRELQEQMTPGEWVPLKDALV